MKGKKVLSFKLPNSQSAVEVMRRLGELRANLEAEAKLNRIVLTIHGPSSEIKKVSREVREIIKGVHGGS